jgi:hypothetical protein
LWSLTVKAVINGLKLSHPLVVKNVWAYVKIALLNTNATMWVKAERNVIGGITYNYWGDELVLPHSKAKLNIEINGPIEEKPLAVIVAIEFEDGSTVYTNIVNVS